MKSKQKYQRTVHRLRYGIAAFAVMVLMSMVLIGTASAADIYVPDNYTTIQAAIDAASSSDTINVAAGTYYEDGQIVIDKDLTIVGADKATTIIKPNHDTTVGSSQSDAWIYVSPDVTFTLSEVTLDGTDLTGTLRIINHAIQSCGELTVEDCIIKNIKADTYYGRGIVISAGESNTIARCEFSEIQRIGIHIRGSVEPTDPIAYIEDCTYVGKGEGDWLDYGIEFGGGGSGTVEGCDISDCTGVTSVDDSTSAGILATDYWGPGTSATVVNSTITGNTDGIAVGYADDDATVLTAYCNDISGNEYGILNVGTVEVDAENNWWGDASGPVHITNPDGTGNMVSDNVDYSPWLGFTVGTTPMTWHTNDNIRDAIDAASSSDTINVAAGTYYEDGQIVIDKDLTIVGADKATTIIKPNHDTTVGSSQSDAWIYVSPDVTFTLSEVTLDGTDLTGTLRIINHAIQSCGELTVEDCIIKNIKADTYYGRGIVISAGESNTIARCEFSEIQRIGIHIRGSVEPTDPIAYIEDCTYVGKGEGDWLDYGIEFGGGGSGTVEGCDISDCTGVTSVDDSTSAGILATDYWGPGTSATVVNSTITGNTDGIAVGYADDDATVLTAYCNDISGNEYGILNVGTVEVDAENNWWGDATGPSGLGPGTGDAVSDNVDYNPWLTYNKLTSSLTYTGAPQPTTAVVLEATLADSTSIGISGVEVDFNLNGTWIGSATTDSNGVATLDITTYPVGVYDVFASVNCLESEHALLAVYDPSPGFVIGGGWIDSPPGACPADKYLTGKVKFSFVSKYKKGADTPTGITRFQFNVADLKLHSDNYDWLVIAGEHAKYKGTGTINDEGEYGFMLTATDGDFPGRVGSDTLRIKIWDKETETVVYDNKLGVNDTEYDGTELGRGNIEIQKAKNEH